MSSPQPYVASSPVSLSLASGRRTKSRFTFKHLNSLAHSSPTSPLRCIALIDYDAFYAQCEQVRLNITDDQPLAVQQWQGLIAINYPARAYGLTRHVTITEAKLKCPHIVIQHVATWREGDDKWAYRPDAFEHIHTDKVSLDPYRLESRRSLALIKEILPAPPVQRVEKASIDEVFLDLSAQIYGVLLERYPELRHAPYDDPSELLPVPPSTALNWEADGLVDLDEAETEDDDPDWDDVVMNIGSEIVREVRRVIKEKLKYTCSAGIARNKMMAKLGAGHKKPNQQTIVRNRAVQHFLSGYKFTKIRNLGGKLGDQIVEAFDTDQVSELLNVPLDQLKSKLGDDTGTWVYAIIRGDDTSEVNSRTQIKSMLSAKSFRPTINSFDQCTKWLRIFVNDIYARLVEEGVVENKRRPKTMNLHHRQSGQMRSRQAVIPGGRKIDVEMLFDLARTLLQQVIAEGKAWPCANLSLSVGGFEDGVTGNRSMNSFLVRGEEAKAIGAASRDTSGALVQEDDRPNKRRKLDTIPRLNRFFKSESTGTLDGNDRLSSPTAEEMAEHQTPVVAQTTQTLLQPNIEVYSCAECGKDLPVSGREEHQDWHFAKSLQTADRASVSGPSNSRPPGPASKSHVGTSLKSRGRPRGTGSLGRSEKGQSRLAFG